MEIETEDCPDTRITRAFTCHDLSTSALLDRHTAHDALPPHSPHPGGLDG